MWDYRHLFCYLLYLLYTYKVVDYPIAKAIIIISVIIHYFKLSILVYRYVVTDQVKSIDNDKSTKLKQNAFHKK